MHRDRVLQGGKFESLPPKPWKTRFGPGSPEKREIVISSHVYLINGPAIGANGHHQASIREDDNYIWSELLDSWLRKGEKEAGWIRPWEPDESNRDQYEEYKKVFKGRQAMNSDFVRAVDVRRWAEEVLSEWGITEEGYSIRWDLDDDDPNAQPETASEMMRRRIERTAGVIPGVLKTPEGLNNLRRGGQL